MNWHLGTSSARIRASRRSYGSAPGADRSVDTPRQRGLAVLLLLCMPLLVLLAPGRVRELADAESVD